MPNSRRLPEDTISSAKDPFTCSKCGELKLPRQRCLMCAVRPHSKLKKPIERSKTKVVLLEPTATSPVLSLTSKNDQGKYRYRTGRARRLRRAQQIRLCAELLQSIRRCFELDVRGQLTLYEDRMGELLPLLKRAEKIMPIILRELDQNNPRKRSKAPD